jgi:hypothetical protein
MRSPLTFRCLLIIALVALLAGAGCGQSGQSKAAPAAAQPQAKAPEAPKATAKVAAADAKPVLSPQGAVAAGPFKPEWESLAAQYQTPEWFRDAKFGIWAHWSAQCVPEQGDWYAKRMYEEGSSDYKYHAAQNHLEYFAELTAIYFVGADYFPKDRAGLKACDPDGYALVEKLWGISGDRFPPSSKEPKGPKP